MLGLYITGINQNSNTIFVTAGLSAVMQSLGYSAGVYKPVETGSDESNGVASSKDLEFIRYVDPFIKTYSTYLLKEKLTPLVAAAAEGVSIQKDRILNDFQDIKNLNEVFIVDGVSGIASPLNKNFLEQDMIKIFDLPLVLVVSPKDSSIDSVLLAINHITDLGIPLRGVILNKCPDNFDDADMQLMPKLIEEYTDANILGVLPSFERDLNPNDLINEVLNGTDIEAVFNVSIPKLHL